MTTAAWLFLVKKHASSLFEDFVLPLEFFISRKDGTTEGVFDKAFTNATSLAVM
jgi:hypothetical protein